MFKISHGRKISLFFSALVLVSLVLSPRCFAVNLLINGDFENGTNNWSAAGVPFTATYAQHHGGTISVTNTITSVTNQDYFGQIYQDYTPVSAENPVYLEGWIKTAFAVGSTARAGIQIDFLNGSNQIIGDPIKTDLYGTNDWFKVYVAGYAPAGTAKVRLSAYIFALKDDNSAIGGTAYVDDLYFDKTTAPGGLMTNTGFESQMSGWTPDQFSATPAVKHSGNYSATATIADWLNQDYWGYTYQEVNLTAGTPIYATAWVKTDISQLAAAKGGLLIQFFNGTTYIPNQDLKSEIGGRTDWRQLYVSGIAPTGTTKIRIGGFIFAADADSDAIGGKVYLDDFVASATQIPPLPPQTDLINADFENGVNDWTPNFRSFVADGSVRHGGNYSARHTIGDTTDLNNDYYAEAYQEFPFAPSQSAYLSAWVKTQLPVNGNSSGGIKIGFYNSSHVLLSAVPTSINRINDWTLLYVYGLAPLNTATIRLSGFAWAAKNQGNLNAPVYIDDVSFSNSAPSGLITNPGFEDAFSGWTQDATGTPMNIDAAIYHGGTHSALANISLPGGTADYWSRVYQQFPFNPGETLYATLYAKTVINPASTATAGLLIEFLDGTSTVLRSARSTISATTDWTYLYVTDTAPAGTVTARVSPFVSCPRASANLLGSAYFDDVVASRDPLSPPEFKTTMVNVGFESGFSGWTDLYATPAQLDNSSPHGGVYSAKKTFIDIPDEDYFSILYQDIYYNAQGLPFPVDKNVYLSAWLKSNIAVPANAKAGIRIEYFDAQDVAHEIGKDEISTVNNWRKLYIAATIPAGAKKVRVSGFGWAKQGDPYAVGGTFNFDDFNYSYTLIPPPSRQTDLLNAGFENGLNEWKDLYGLPTEVAADPHQGIYSAKKTIGVTPDEDYASIVYQDIYSDANGTPFPANQDVYLQAYLKSTIDPRANARVGIKLEYFDAQGLAHQIGKDEISAVNSAWRALYIAANTVETRIPAGAIKVRVSGYAFALKDDPYAEGGTVHLDDFDYSYSVITPPPLSGALLNAGFENGLNDWNDPFKPALVNIDAQGIHEGGISGKMIIDDVHTASYYGEISQDVALTPGKIVSAKVWAKTAGNPLSNASAGLSIWLLNASGNFLAGSGPQTIGGNTPWTQLQVGPVTAPTGAVKARILLSFSAPEDLSSPYEAEGDIAYFDAASLTIQDQQGGHFPCFLKGTKIKLADGKEVPIEEIQVGDKVLSYEGGRLSGGAVLVTKAHLKEKYFVLTTEDGSALNVTGVHPLFTGEKKGYVRVDDLKAGDTIYFLKDGKLRPQKIVSKILQPQEGDVYDIELDKVHNYFADGCLVHNRKLLYMIRRDGDGDGGQW